MLVPGAIFLVACDDDDKMVIEYNYLAQIQSPNSNAKHVNDSIHIHVDFESQTGEIVHHVNVRIYNLDDPSIEIYNKPTGAHIHEEDGYHEHHDDFHLSNANGVNGHTDWVLEAKVWAEEPGEGEVMDTIHFHVHPM